MLFIDLHMAGQETGGQIFEGEEPKDHRALRFVERVSAGELDGGVDAGGIDPLAALEVQHAGRSMNRLAVGQGRGVGKVAILRVDG